MTCELFVLGDSHAGIITAAAYRLGYNVAGRAVGPGRDFIEGRFSFGGDGEFVLEEPASMARYRAGLAQAGVANLAELKGVPVLTTFGFQLDRQIWAMGNDFTLNLKDKHKHIMSMDAFKCAILDARAKLLDFIAWMVGLGLDVTVVTPPPRNKFRALFCSAEDVAAAELRARGARVHLTREWSAGANGFLKPEYLPDNKEDVSHANLAYAFDLMRRLAPDMELRTPDPSEARDPRQPR
jgi:hypothetical protein